MTFHKYDVSHFNIKCVKAREEVRGLPFASDTTQRYFRKLLHFIICFPLALAGGEDPNGEEGSWLLCATLATDRASVVTMEITVAPATKGTCL